MSDDLIHDIIVQPSYDYRDIEEGPTARGAHGMVLSFILRGPKGAISFDLGTDWMAHPLKQTFNWSAPKPWDRSDIPGLDYNQEKIFHSPMTQGCYSHSLTKDRGYWSGPSECNILGVPCYGDGGYMVADRVLAAMVAEGSEGLWREMRHLYDAWLGEESHG